MENPLSYKVLLPLGLTTIISMFSGCASLGDDFSQIERGASKRQIVSALGEPDDRAIRGNKAALQYYELVGFGQCKYTTVWIRDDSLVGISSRRGGSAFGCGLGSDPVDWSQFPEPAPEASDT